MKNLTKIFSLIFAILLIGGLFTACTQDTPETPDVPDTPDTQEHVHGSTHWYTNKIAHWQICSCGETINKGPHEGGTATNESAAICAVCGMKYGGHVHEFGQWRTSDDYHLKKCSCGLEAEKGKHTGGTATQEHGPICEICGNEYGEHLHDASGEWESNSINHWKICSCGKQVDIEKHVGGTATYESGPICDICGNEYGEHLHTAASEWISDEISHWKECACGQKTETGSHTSDSALRINTCNVCGAAYSRYGKVADGHDHVAPKNTSWNDEYHWFRCSKCNGDYNVGKHTGGTATVDARAVCEVCGKSYGNLVPLDLPNLIQGAKYTYVDSEFVYMISSDADPINPAAASVADRKVYNLASSIYQPLYWIYYLRDLGYTQTASVTQSRQQRIHFILDGDTFYAEPYYDVQYTAYDKDGNVIEFLKEHGDNPVGDMLKKRFSTKYDVNTGKTVTKDSFVMDGSTSTIPLEIAFRMGYYGETEDEATAKVKHNSTYGSFTNLVNGSCDLIFSALISDGQREAAEQAGLDLAEIPICMEAFVFVVNADNPVEELTVQQLKDIYSGKITNWKELGGNDAPIEAFQRNLTSGSQNYMTLFMGDTPLMEPITHITPATMEGLMEIVSSYNNALNAIGYSVYSYAANMYADAGKVKFIKVNGIAPTPETLGDLSYPLLNYNYAIYDKNNPNTEIEKIVNWILTEEGQKAVVEGGYVPLKGGTLPEYVNGNKAYQATGTGREASKEPQYGGVSTAYIPVDVEYPENYLEDCIYYYFYGTKYPLIFGAKYTIDGLANEDLEKEINDFIEKAVNEAESKFPEMYDLFRRKAAAGEFITLKEPVKVTVTGQNGYISIVVSTGYLDEGNDGGNPRLYYAVAATYDLRTGKKLESLSDLFPKGSNFVDDLNRSLSMDILAASRDDFDTYGIRQFDVLTADEALCFTYNSIIFPVDSRVSGNSYNATFYANSLATEYCDMRQFFTEDFEGTFSEGIKRDPLGRELRFPIGGNGTAGVYYPSDAKPELIKAAESLAEYINGRIDEDALIKDYHDAGYDNVVDIEYYSPVYIPYRIGNTMYNFVQIGETYFAWCYGVDADGNRIYDDDVNHTLGNFPSYIPEKYYWQDTGEPVNISLKEGWEEVATVIKTDTGAESPYSELKDKISIDDREIELLIYGYIATSYSDRTGRYYVRVIIPQEYIIVE